MKENISPCSENTLNTLRYANRIKKLRKPRHEWDGENNNKYNINNSNGYNNSVKMKKNKENELINDAEKFRS